MVDFVFKNSGIYNFSYHVIILHQCSTCINALMSHIMRKPTMWFLSRTDTNRGVQAQMAREPGNFGFRKKRNCTMHVAKTKALISSAATWI